MAIFLVVVVLAILAGALIGFRQYLNQPRYKDCPFCNTTIRYRASICPACVKYIPAELDPSRAVHFSSADAGVAVHRD
jgi:hypothetical protein